MAPHSSTLAWKIPWTAESGRQQSKGSLRVEHSWATSLSFSCIGGWNGNPLQCSCLENPKDGGAWLASVYGVAQSWTWLKRLSSSSSRKKIYQGTETSLKSNVKYWTNWMSSNRTWDLIKVMNSRSSIKSLPIFNYINLYSVLEWSEIKDRVWFYSI